MAKNKRIEQKQTVRKATVQQYETNELIVKKPFFSINDFRFQSVIIAVIGFIFYFNTFNLGFAFDDKIVLTQNEYVQSGFAGIPKILTGESYESFSKQQRIGNPLTGGRYRPLSIITFAIEQQLLGTTDVINANPTKEDINSIRAKQAKLVNDMHLRHFDNVLLYIISVIVLLYFLRQTVFKTNYLAAFLAAIIFLVHPVHTEVVANVKSRDEILSLLFICLTFIRTFVYLETNKLKDLLIALCCFFLALLSKEYAVMLIILLPVSLYLFKNYDIGKCISSLKLFLIPVVVYFFLRFSSVSATAIGAEDEIMNNPYLYATPIQAFASKFSIMLNYIKLLLFPNQLSADYSFNQIPYTNLSDFIVWLSLLLHLSLIVLFVFLIIKRHVLAFAIGVYIVFFALVCNVFVNIGAPMGERFIYHSSVGFAIIIAWLIYKGYKKLGSSIISNVSLVVFMSIIILLSGFKTIDRNKYWDSDATLFLNDVKTVPNSIIANCNAGAACLDMAEEEKNENKKKEWYLKGIPFLNKAVQMHPKYMLAYINRGIIYFKLNDFEKSLSDCDTVKKYFPQHPSLTYLSYSLTDYYFKLGLQNGRNNNPAEAIVCFKKAIDAVSTDADLWYNLGYAYFTTNQFEEAKKAFSNSLRLKPNHPQAKNMLEQIKRQEK